MAWTSAAPRTSAVRAVASRRSCTAWSACRGVILKIVPQPRVKALRSARRCPIEVPVGGLNQPGSGRRRRSRRKLCSVVSVPPGVILKIVPQPKYCRYVPPPCGPVEVPVGGLDQARARVDAVSAVELGAKAIKCGQRAARGDLEDRSTAHCVVAEAVAVDPPPSVVP